MERERESILCLMPAYSFLQHSKYTYVLAIVYQFLVKYQFRYITFRLEWNTIAEALLTSLFCLRTVSEFQVRYTYFPWFSTSYKFHYLVCSPLGSAVNKKPAILYY